MGATPNKSRADMATRQDHKRRRTQLQNHPDTKNFARSTVKGTNSCASSQSRSYMESSASRIRQNYLRTIGIERRQGNMFPDQTRTINSPPTKPLVPSRQEPLHCREEAEMYPNRECAPDAINKGSDISHRNWADNFSTNSLSVSPSSVMSITDPRPAMVPLRKEICRRVSFGPSVCVRPIPTRSEYSDRMKSQIWSSRHELQMNAQRNVIEFTAENWDWRQAASDDDMIICDVTGERVHPIHYVRAAQHYNSLQKENLLLLSRMAAMRWGQR